MGYRTTLGIGLLVFAAVGGVLTINSLSNSSKHAPGVAQPSKPRPEQEDVARATTNAFADVDTIRSVDGVLRATLAVKYADGVIGGSRVRFRTYDGRVVGPTLRVKPGDVLKIRLENRLPPSPLLSPKEREAAVHSVNVPHALNSTNIHTHGLHVSPEGKSDNVYVDIKPGQAHEYEIAIPKDHVAGTFWYHPHRHGSVALQVANGLGGALIVEGGLDDDPSSS